MSVPLLSIIIVSFNTKDLLAGCLRSIRCCPPPVPYETIVVDNASADASPEMVQAEFPEVGLLRNETNVGFGAANNRGCQAAKGTMLLFLNSDTELLPNGLEPLLRRLQEQSRTAIVGPTEESSDGTPYPTICPDPTLWYLVLTHTGLRHRLYRHAWINPYRRIWEDALSSQRPVAVGWVSGASLLVRRAVLDQVGPFDEGYFMYMEEADLCLRAKRAGWGVEYVPEGRVRHHGGGSSGKARQGLLTLSSAVSELRYFSKHRSPVEQILLKGLLFAEYAVLFLVTSRTNPRRWAYREILRLILGRRETRILGDDLRSREAPSG